MILENMIVAVNPPQIGKMKNEILINTTGTKDITAIITDFYHILDVISSADMTEVNEMVKISADLYDLYDNVRKDNISLQDYDVAIFDEAHDKKTVLNPHTVRKLGMVVNFILPLLQDRVGEICPTVTE